jgi:hypothetical protein
MHTHRFCIAENLGLQPQMAMRRNGPGVCLAQLQLNVFDVSSPLAIGFSVHMRALILAVVQLASSTTAGERDKALADH